MDCKEFQGEDQRGIKMYVTWVREIVFQDEQGLIVL